ncbi:uncharacterized protein LOC115218806 [Argonauta hians]
MVENILKDILLSSNEKPPPPTLPADKHQYSSTCYAASSHRLLPDQPYHYVLPRMLNQPESWRNQLSAAPSDLRQIASQSVSMLDPPSPTGSSPLFILDEVNYGYYNPNFRDVKWSNEENNPIPSAVCEAFREDASWYESHFEDPFNTVHSSPVARTTALSEVTTSSGHHDPNSKLRARLYKRHPSPLSSSSSLDDIQSYNGDKTDNFSMLLGPFVESQPPVYSSEKISNTYSLSTTSDPTTTTSTTSTNSTTNNTAIDTLCLNKQVGSPVHDSKPCDKTAMMMMKAVSKLNSECSDGNIAAASINCSNDAMLTTATTTHDVWSPVTMTCSASQVVGAYSPHTGKNLPMSGHSAASLLSDNMQQQQSFPGHFLVDIQASEPASAVGSIVYAPHVLLPDSDSDNSVAASTLLSTCAVNNPCYLSPALHTPITCSTVNTTPSSNSPCSTSSLSLVDLSYLTHIAECDPSLQDKPSSGTDDEQSSPIVDVGNLEESEMSKSATAATTSTITTTNTTTCIAAAVAPLAREKCEEEDATLLRSATLTPGHHLETVKRSKARETPENYMTAIYNKLDSSLPAELFSRGNQKWHQQMVFDMGLLWQQHQQQQQLRCDKEGLGKAEAMLAAVVEPVDGKSTSLPDFSLINHLWCRNCAGDSDGEFFTKSSSSSLSQLWNINCQKRLTMSSSQPTLRPHSTLCSSYSPQLKHHPNPFTLFLPTVHSSALLRSDSTSSSSSSFSSPPSSSANMVPLPPISSFLYHHHHHDDDDNAAATTTTTNTTGATSLFSPVSIFPSTATILTNNKNNIHNNNNNTSISCSTDNGGGGGVGGNWDYFCCNYYNVFGTSPISCFYHHHHHHRPSWPPSSSSFFSSPLFSPPLTTSNFLFPLSSYSSDFDPEKPLISFPIKVLPTSFGSPTTTTTTTTTIDGMPCLLDMKDNNILYVCDNDLSQSCETETATCSVPDNQACNQTQTQVSTMPSPSSTVSITTPASVATCVSQATPVSMLSSSSPVSSSSPCLLSSSPPSSLPPCSTIGPFQASELIPSECSAFQDVIPRRQAVTAAKLCDLLRHNNNNKSLEEEEEEEEELVHEMLYFSPRTHFRPIKTPPGVGFGHQIRLDALSAVTAVDLLVASNTNHAKSQRFIPEGLSTLAPILYQPPDLFGGHPECRSPYQDFYQAEPIEDNLEKIPPKVGFVPKFRLHRNTDKYIQTGMSSSSHGTPSLPPHETQCHYSQQLGEHFVDYDLEKLAEEVCSEDNFGGAVLTGFEPDAYMALCPPDYSRGAAAAAAFSIGEKIRGNNTASSIWSYDKQTDSAGSSSISSPWGRYVDGAAAATTTAASTAANMLGLMASDAKNHYSKTWSRGSDEIPNWTPVAEPPLNWTSMAPQDSWPIAVSSSASSCSSAALDPSNYIHAFSQPLPLPSSMADDARNFGLNTARGEEQWRKSEVSCQPVTVAPGKSIGPPFNMGCNVGDSNLPMTSKSDEFIASKSDSWKQQSNAWLDSQNVQTWQPLPAGAINPTMWDSNDGCGDTGADHWMLESPSTEGLDWPSETPGKCAWPKDVGIRSESKDFSKPTTGGVSKSWSVDGSDADQLDWYLRVTSSVNIPDTKKSLMEVTAKHRQSWKAGSLVEGPVKCADSSSSSDIWCSKQIVSTSNTCTEHKLWSSGGESCLNETSYCTSLPKKLSDEPSTWLTHSEKPCSWPRQYAEAKTWLPEQSHQLCYGKMVYESFPEVSKSGSIGGVTKDMDIIYRESKNDDVVVDNNNIDERNNNDCNNEIIANFAGEFSALKCKGTLKKTGAEWLSEKSDHVDWTYVKDMCVALHWPSVPAATATSCTGTKSEAQAFTATHSAASNKTTIAVGSACDKVGPLHCTTSSSVKTTNSLTLAHTDKSLALSSSSWKKSYEEIEALAPLPSEAVYSSELEEEWLNSETPTTTATATVQFQPGKQLSVKSLSLKKPCSFFLEGNCRRSECKFSHDISTITCRFWEDGECFKGDTCPFLHGYYATVPTTASAPATAQEYGSDTSIEAGCTGSKSSREPVLHQSNVTDSAPGTSLGCQLTREPSHL